MLYTCTSLTPATITHSPTIIFIHAKLSCTFIVKTNVWHILCYTNLATAVTHSLLWLEQSHYPKWGFEVRKSEEIAPTSTSSVYMYMNVGCYDWAEVAPLLSNLTSIAPMKFTWLPHLELEGLVLPLAFLLSCIHDYWKTYHWKIHDQTKELELESS